MAMKSMLNCLRWGRYRVCSKKIMMSSHVYFNLLFPNFFYFYFLHNLFSSISKKQSLQIPTALLLLIADPVEKNLVFLAVASFVIVKQTITWLTAFL